MIRNLYVDRLPSACPTLIEISGTVLDAVENWIKTTEVLDQMGPCGNTLMLATTPP